MLQVSLQLSPCFDIFFFGAAKKRDGQFSKLTQLWVPNSRVSSGLRSCGSRRWASVLSRWSTLSHQSIGLGPRNGDRKAASPERVRGSEKRLIVPIVIHHDFGCDPPLKAL